MLLRAYQSAVVQEARKRKLPHGDFGEAMMALPWEVFDALRNAYRAQVEVLSSGDGADDVTAEQEGTGTDR